MKITHALPRWKQISPPNIKDCEGSSGIDHVAQGSKSGYLNTISRWAKRLGFAQVFQQKPRRLRVRETVSLGEKRFISIIEVDGVSLLIGGGSASVSLLTQLGGQPLPSSFGGALEKAWEGSETA